MKYSLRSLMITALVVPPAIWLVLRFYPQQRRIAPLPNYKDNEALRIILKVEREHGPLKTIGN